MADYYEQHAERFFQDTVALDMRPLHSAFLALIPDGGFILDAGCGSGRDSKAFQAAGHRVQAFDASPRMAELAERHLGQPVRVLRFNQVEWQQRFDGIWACASLLHVPTRELPDALRRLARAMKRGGAFYASFKHGDGERENGGRRFTDMNETRLRQLLQQSSDLSLHACWITADRRPDRTGPNWLNALLIRR